MALIKCPECGKEISDKAPHCIHCGYPMELIKEEVVETTPVRLYRVYLKSCSDELRADTIKMVSEFAGLSLVEAKNIVNACPVCIKENVLDEDLKQIIDTFDKVKAVIEYNEMDVNSDSELPYSLKQKEKKEVPSMIVCPTCGMSVSSQASSCPHCGHAFVKVRKGLGFWGVVGAILVSVLILMFL